VQCLLQGRENGRRDTLNDGGGGSQRKDRNKTIDQRQQRGYIARSRGCGETLPC
jgi:hypothetical protein